MFSRKKDPSARSHSQAQSGSGPAREGGLRPRSWGGPHAPHAHHVCQRSPTHLRHQGHYWSRPSCGSGPDPSANVSVGRRRTRSRAALRHRETSRRLSRWRCFCAHWKYWPRAPVSVRHLSSQPAHSSSRLSRTPPSPPPGQYRPQSTSHRTTLLPSNRAARRSDPPESPPTPPITISPSDRPVAITTDRASEGAVG